MVSVRVVTVSPFRCSPYSFVGFPAPLAGFDAVEAIFKVFREQSTPTFDEDGRIISFYNIVGHTSPAFTLPFV